MTQYILKECYAKFIFLYLTQVFTKGKLWSKEEVKSSDAIIWNLSSTYYPQPTWHRWPFQFDARHFKIVNVQAYKFATGQFIFKTAVSKSHGELVTFFSESFTFPNRPYWIIQARSTLRKLGPSNLRVNRSEGAVYRSTFGRSEIRANLRRFPNSCHQSHYSCDHLI